MKICFRKASSMWQEYVTNAESRNLVSSVETNVSEHDIRRKLWRLLKK